MNKGVKQLFIAVFFGILGISVEVFFTAFSALFASATKDMSLKGESYVWMFFIYALIGPLFTKFYPNISKYHIALRILIYGTVILAIEFVTGFLLDTFTGQCPWHYTTGITFYGYIRLDYIFFWMIFGFFIEKIYLFLDKMEIH